jgi:hypothetical protein
MHLLTKSPTSSGPIVSHPRLQELRAGRALFLILTAGFFAFLMLSSFVESIFSGHFSFPWNFSIFLLTLLAGAGLFSLCLSYWKRIDLLRFEVALGDTSFLANEQPPANSEALPVATTITTNSSVEYALLLGYLSLMSLALMILSFSTLTFLSWFWSLVLTGLIEGAFLFALFLMASGSRSLEIAQEGIKERTPKETYLVRWHEMQFFVCYHEPGPWSHSPALIYELSSESHVLTWTCLQRDNRLYSLARCFFPFEKARARAQALCSLVVAKTGLALYDLRNRQEA